MIPKIIHYCWFSNEPLPDQAVKCIESWKKWLPQYEIKRWSLNDFDVNLTQFTKDALDSKKWAFLTDYVRHYALYKWGGIYMDSDVMLYGNIEKLLDAEFVSACEYHPSFDERTKNQKDKILNPNGCRISNNIKVYGIGVQAAFMASIPKHEICKSCMSFYQKHSLEDVLNNRYTAPTVIAYNMEKYGFRYIDEEQKLYKNKIHLYKTNIISNYDQKGRKSLVVHWCAGSWVNRNNIEVIKHKLNKFMAYRIIRDILKKIKN